MKNKKTKIFFTMLFAGIFLCIAFCVCLNIAKTGSSIISVANAADAGTTFTNPLGFKTVEDLLGNILVAVQRIVGVLALVFIVIGAIMILSSAGTPEMVERGKKAITMACIGLAIGVAAPSILKELGTAKVGEREQLFKHRHSLKLQ